MPWAKKFFWVNVGVMATLFVLGVLDLLAVIRFPLAHYLAPVSLMLLLPAIKRDTIPFVRLLERIGRRSYGIYLSHLIVLNLVLIGLRWLIPGLFNIYIILFPLLFLIGLLVPLLVMEWMTKGPTKQYYRYVFG